MQGTGKENLSELAAEKSSESLEQIIVNHLCAERRFEENELKILQKALLAVVEDCFRIKLPECDCYLAANSAAGRPIKEIYSQLVNEDRFSEQDFKGLLNVAFIWDALKKTQNPPIAFIPDFFLLDSTGKVSIPSPFLHLLAFNNKQPRLSEFQKNFCKSFMHPEAALKTARIDISSAMNYSFVMFLAEIFWKVHGSSVAELCDKVKKARFKDKKLPPEAEKIFLEHLSFPVDKPASKSCQQILAEILRSFAVSPFRMHLKLSDKITHSVVARCDSGRMKVNGQMEDCHLFLGDDQTKPVTIMIVADGVSTASLGTGGQAAREILSLFERSWRAKFIKLKGIIQKYEDSSWSELADNFLRDFFSAANEHIVSCINNLYKSESRADEPATMCSTLTTAIIYRDQAVIAYAGDSPAFLFCSALGSFSKLTTDHNVAMQSDFSIEKSEDASSLTEFIGKCYFDKDKKGYLVEKILVDSMQIQLSDGDFLLIGSDGIVDCVRGPNEEEKIVAMRGVVDQWRERGEKVSELSASLVNLANAGSAHDNITALVLHLQKEKENV